MRILHGVTDYAGQASYSVKGLKDLGYNCKKVTYINREFDFKSDYNLGFEKSKPYLFPLYLIKMIRFTFFAIKNFDVFHFHAGHSLLLWNIDLWFLKKLKKRIFFEFHGDELRRESHAPWRHAKTNREKKADLKQHKRNKKRVSYADGIILHDEELRVQLPPCSAPVFIVPLRCNTKYHKDINFTSHSNICTIIHAPSDSNVKGSSYVISAMEELMKTHKNIDFKLIQNMKHEDAMKEYEKADIIIDQVIAGCYGVFAIEGMTMYKPVCVYISETMVENYPEDLPVINSTKDNIAHTLEPYLNNKKALEELGNKSHEYANKYHNYKHNAKILYEIYNGEYEAKYTGRKEFERVANI